MRGMGVLSFQRGLNMISKKLVKLLIIITGLISSSIATEQSNIINNSPINNNNNNNLLLNLKTDNDNNTYINKNINHHKFNNKNDNDLLLGTETNSTSNNNDFNINNVFNKLLDINEYQSNNKIDSCNNNKFDDKNCINLNLNTGKKNITNNSTDQHLNTKIENINNINNNSTNQYLNTKTQSINNINNLDLENTNELNNANNKKEDKNNNYDPALNNCSNNTADNATHPNKKKRKRRRNKKNKEQSNYKFPPFMDSDDCKELFKNMEDRLDRHVKSTKFVMLGNIHKQIMECIQQEKNNSAVINSKSQDLYNKFNLNSDILNKYKQYYDKLINHINDLMPSTNANALFNFKLFETMYDVSEITIDIHKLLNNEDLELDDENVNYISELVIDEQINSENDLQGNNIFKVIENLSVAISDWCLYAQPALFQLVFSLLKNDKHFSKASKHLYEIGKIFYIKEITKMKVI